MLPLAVSLSQSQLRFISTLGMGVLVGTSLIVIIPEGIDTLYSASAVQARTVVAARGAGPGVGVGGNAAWPAVLLPERRVAAELSGSSVVWERDDGDSGSSSSGGGATDEALPPPSLPPLDKHEDAKHGHDEEEARSPHNYVGLSLISGFILMYLIDALPATAASRGGPEPYQMISMDSLRSLSAPSASSSSSGGPGSRSSSSAAASSTTLGLVIHAAADGIALGASSSASNAALSAIIFLAIMLHKAPAAFALTAVLLRSGLAKRQARAHLLVFSAAAPVGAFVTWLLVRLIGGAPDGILWWTGVLLLFSGGTFLYVAMHAMMELGGHDGLGGGGGGAGGGGNGGKRGLRDVAAVVGGMVLPLLTQVGHHHH